MNAPLHKPNPHPALDVPLRALGIVAATFAPSDADLLRISKTKPNLMGIAAFWAHAKGGRFDCTGWMLDNPHTQSHHAKIQRAHQQSAALGAWTAFATMLVAHIPTLSHQDIVLQHTRYTHFRFPDSWALLIDGNQAAQSPTLPGIIIALSQSLPHMQGTPTP